MKRKLLIIIFTSIIITYFIYFVEHQEKINLTALGDGISSGETSYGIDGISYNDYLKKYYENKNILKKYNNTYSHKNYKINELIIDINNNKYDKENKKHLKQIIHNSDIITLSIGEDELTKLSITNDLTKDNLEKYLKDYDKLLSILKEITEAKIVIISLYENDYLNKTNIILLNSALADLSNKYNTIFINISDLALNNDYYLNKNSYYFSYKAHEEIAKIIVHSI